jgi:DNA-binding MarR family transcriptional regulator
MQLARATDPVSSHAAANNVASFAAIHYAAILSLLKEHPKSTASELAQYTHLDRYQIGRRMKELEKRGHIQRVAIRTCSVGNRIATSWELKGL